MAIKKEDGSVEMHLRFYPEKYEAHRIFMEQIRKYQETMGVGASDALVAMLYPLVKEREEQERQKREEISRKNERKQERPGEKEEPEGYRPSLFYESGSGDSGLEETDLFKGEL